MWLGGYGVIGRLIFAMNTIFFMPWSCIPFCYEYHLFYALAWYAILFIPIPLLCNLIAGSGGTAEVGAPLRWVWVVGGLVHRLRDGLAGPRGWAGSSGGWTLGR